MGFETLILIGGTLLSAAGKASAAQSKAQAVVDQANLASKNKAKEVARKVGKQRVSFLGSGFTLDGTPSDVIEGTFETGVEDLNQIKSNADRQSKGIINAARFDIISSFATAAAGASFGGAPSAAPTGGTLDYGLGSSPFTGTQDTVFGNNNSFGGFD